MRRLGQTISMLAKTRSLANFARPSAGILQETPLFGANPGQLGMLTYVPKTVGIQRALVVVLHGCTQSAEGYANGAGWIEAADRFGFALLCPQQASANNPNLCFNWFVPGDTRRESGEPASIAWMISHMIDKHALDTGQVYITGLSAGGAMANVMLATYPELFNAGAIIAGLPFGSAGNVQEAFAAMAHQRDASDETLGNRVRNAAGGYTGPWPKISVWHGDNDTTVSPLAGDAVARQWANVHDATAASSSVPARRRHRVWEGADGTARVEHHAIPGMGHGTPLHTGAPDAVGSQGPYLLEVGISSTLEIVEAWGLKALQSAENAAPKQFERLTAAPMRPAPQTTTPIAKPSPIDVGSVINNALRAAGLLK